MSVPRLSFRQPPLRIKIRKIPTVKKTRDIESQESQETPVTSTKPLYFIICISIIVLLRIVSMFVFKSTPHTIKKLKCSRKLRTLSCYGADPVGTFAVQIPSLCAGSVYDVGGFPFSVADHGGTFKVPAKDLYVKDVNGVCDVKAYIDSSPLTLTFPFTWVTTNQHTAFTILDGNNIIVDKAPVSLFKSVSRGPWIAYTYDIPGATAKVVGDGTDIIHTYNGVSK